MSVFKRDEVVLASRLVQQRYDFYGTDTVAFTYVVHEGLVQAGSGLSVTLATTASSTDDAYNGYNLMVTAGTGSGQDRAMITAYNGTTKVATLSAALDTTLDTTSYVKVINRGY